MQDGIFEKKKALRGKYLEMRKALAKEDVEIMSGAVIKRLLKAINGNENSVLLYPDK
jgi:hypothetical protein